MHSGQYGEYRHMIPRHGIPRKVVDGYRFRNVPMIPFGIGPLRPVKDRKCMDSANHHNATFSNIQTWADLEDKLLLSIFVS